MKKVVLKAGKQVKLNYKDNHSLDQVYKDVQKWLTCSYQPTQYFRFLL